MEEIRCERLSFCYPDREEDALREVSFSLSAASFAVLCGRSGCGKSTLLRHLKASMTPYGDRRGEVLYRGTPIDRLDPRTAACAIGFVQQDPDAQLVTDKVWHELAFGLENLGLPTPEIRRRVAEMASFFGIQDWFHRDVYALSGGQKQLLNLAAVMAMQPQVLVLDEPTSQLDPIAASEFFATLAKINRELGTTVFLSEHRLEEAFPLADRVMVMEGGRIAAFDTPQAVSAQLSRAGQAHPMYLGLPAAVRICAGVQPQGPCPVTVREGRLWLDDLFPQGVPQPALPERDTAPPPPAEPALALENVWFRYRRGEDEVVRGLSLTVRRREWYCLLGGNGAGKSTALKLIAGLLKPNRGRVKVADGLALGVLPQNPQALFTELRAEEELFDALADLPGTDRARREGVEEMLALLELTGRRAAHPYDLSGGEQQRLALGKILLRQPQILLLDEPTKGLDPFFKASLAKLLKSLLARGLTLFMVSHDIEFCAEYGDTCALFFDGCIASQDPPRRFFGGNSFYTTSANRMSRHLFAEAVTCQDVITLCAMNLTANSSGPESGAPSSPPPSSFC